jgi:hypothetical protein
MGKIPRLLMGRYELDRLLGKGSFAKVYHALNVGTGEEVAIKIGGWRAQVAFLCLAIASLGTRIV